MERSQNKKQCKYVSSIKWFIELIQLTTSPFMEFEMNLHEKAKKDPRDA